jgi:hypothetical protein
MTSLDALPLIAIAWIVLALAAAGLVHGTLGLGFPLVATPLIALITDIKTAVVLVAPATFGRGHRGDSHRRSVPADLARLVAHADLDGAR